MLRIILILFFISSQYAFAVGPEASSQFFRADTRPPKEIFGTTGNIGPGFQTWAAARGVLEDNNVLAYLSGATVRPAPESARNAGWVSVSGSLPSVTNFLNIEIVGDPEVPPPEIQWIYTVAPTSDAYSANWMILEYAGRVGMRGLIDLLHYLEEDEWIVRGGIPAEHIIEATMYRYEPITRRYLSEGAPVLNPHYIQPLFPEPQSINPINGTMPDTIYGYVGSGATNNSVPVFTSLSMSCAGIGASKQNQKGALPPAKGCDYSEKAIITIEREKPRMSKLVLSDGYCLRPVNALAQSKMYQRSYLYLDYCKDNEVAYYDLAHRIVFPLDQDGLEVCMTAPEHVLDSYTEWDYVQFWPCDIKNPYQRWFIRDGKIFSLLKPDLYVNIKGWYGVMSKKNNYGSTYLLDKDRMSKYFFLQSSNIQSITTEIGISWVDPNGRRYYPSASVMSNGKYDERTYYDLDTKQIFILGYKFSPPFSSGSKWKKCLSSRNNKWSNWDWADWKVCDPLDHSQEWNIIYERDTNPIENVHFTDLNNHYLYFDLSHSLNYGAPYTQQGIPEKGSYLDIKRSYGICTTQKGWAKCFIPLHTEVENDGEYVP